MRIRQRIADLFVTKHRQSFGYSNLRFRCRTIRGYGTVLSVLVCLLLSSSPSSAQTLEWAKQAVGTSTDQGRGIAVDTSGNSYVAGFFAAEFGGSATFGAGEANETTLVSVGSGDIFVAKYDGNGGLVRAKQAGGINFQAGHGIAVDTSGNSDVTGHFQRSATFGAGEANETTLVSADFSDIFVAKFSADSDGDGVNDADDACPDSDLGETLVIGGIDTGVDNDLLGDGCSLADLIDAVLAEDPATNVIIHFLVALKKEGIITGRNMGAILKALNNP